jgi:hypothetical protein
MFISPYSMVQFLDSLMSKSCQADWKCCTPMYILLVKMYSKQQSTWPESDASWLYFQSPSSGTYSHIISSQNFHTYTFHSKFIFFIPKLFFHKDSMTFYIHMSGTPPWWSSYHNSSTQILPESIVHHVHNHIQNAPAFPAKFGWNEGTNEGPKMKNNIPPQHLSTLSQILAPSTTLNRYISGWVHFA